MGVAELLGSGPFDRARAAEAGVGRRALDALVLARRVVRITRGVYLPTWLLDDPRARAAAIAGVVPAGAAVCRETAAWLHGVDARPPGSHLQLPRLQVVVPRTSTPPMRPGVQAYQSDLPSSDVVCVAGVPATTVARTALDLLRWTPPFVGLGVLDEWAHRGAVDLDDLDDRVRRLCGQRFVARARRLLSLCEPATESQGESWMRLRVIDAGLPRPAVQIPIVSEGHTLYRLDAGYEELRVGFEYDGEEFHSGTDAEAADEARRADLARRFGWTVIGVRREHVLAARPAVEAVVAELIGWSPGLRRRAW